MKAKSALSSVFASCVAVACLFAVVPAASADEGTVTSTKSFPSYSQVRRNLTAEATSTSTDDNSSWGDVESLNVPQTQSQAEKKPQLVRPPKSRPLRSRPPLKRLRLNPLPPAVARLVLR